MKKSNTELTEHQKQLLYNRVKRDCSFEKLRDFAAKGEDNFVFIALYHLFYIILHCKYSLNTYVLEMFDEYISKYGEASKDYSDIKDLVKRFCQRRHEIANAQANEVSFTKDELYECISLVEKIDNGEEI